MNPPNYTPTAHIVEISEEYFNKIPETNENYRETAKRSSSQIIILDFKI